MKAALNNIKTMVESIAAKIDAPFKYLSTYGNSRKGHPFIEIDVNGQLYYKIYERGQEIQNEYAADEEDLFYRIFADNTLSMALEYEIYSRIEEQESRRGWFVKQLELLEELNLRVNPSAF